MLKHAVSIMWSDEDQGFIASIPGVEGLSAFGQTQTEALEELQTAAKAFFASLKKHHRAIPAPETITHYSGQLRLRMPRSLHAELAKGARREGISLNTYILTLLSSRAAQQTIRDNLMKTEIPARTASPKSISESALKEKYPSGTRPARTSPDSKRAF